MRLFIIKIVGLCKIFAPRMCLQVVQIPTYPQVGGVGLYIDRCIIIKYSSTSSLIISTVVLNSRDR